MTKPIRIGFVALTLILQTLVPANSFRAQAPYPARAANHSARVKSEKETASTPRDQAALTKLFDEFAAKQMALDKTPGMTIGFMQGDSVWVKGYGYADLENRVPAKSESAYRLASVTKPMTAVAIMQLVEKGKINLDAEVQTYVPYFPKKPWPVTVRQVLGHLGGISHYKNPADELHIKDHRNTRQAIAIFENFDLIAEPGTRYSYSSYGYNLLGAVIESASGMSYGDYMRQNVWQPLGMTDTRMDDPLEVIPNRVRGYQLVNGQVKNSEFVDISSRFAAGGTRSTVPDLLKFAKGIMDGKLVSAQGMNVLTTSMSSKDGRLTDYSMGWETTPFSGRYMITHSGGQQETRTLLYIFPTRRLAIAVGVNFEGSSPGVYVDRLFQLVTGAPLFLDPYSSDKVKASIIDAVNDTFNYGFAYFEHYRKGLTSDNAELAEAFGYFNAQVNPEALKENPESTKTKIQDGIHPIAKEAFTKVGAYMAVKLKEASGAKGLADYEKLGCLEFFSDYVALSKSDVVPKEMQFKESFSELVTAMAQDWRKSNSDYVRQLWLMPDDNFDQVAARLRASFNGTTVYPFLVNRLTAVSRQQALKGDRAAALKTGQLAAELYPESGRANFVYGVVLILNQDPTRGKMALKKTIAINPSGAASAGGLNDVAYEIAGTGSFDDAIAVLKVAVEIYPQEANLYDSLGEFQLKKGDKARALESYRKALELNPNFANAEGAREIVKRLTAELGAG